MTQKSIKAALISLGGTEIDKGWARSIQSSSCHYVGIKISTRPSYIKSQAIIFSVQRFKEIYQHCKDNMMIPAISKRGVDLQQSILNYMRTKKIQTGPCSRHASDTQAGMGISFSKELIARSGLHELICYLEDRKFDESQLTKSIAYTTRFQTITEAPSYKTIETFQQTTPGSRNKFINNVVIDGFFY